MNRRIVRISRRKRTLMGVVLSLTFGVGSCPSISFDSELGRAFREAYVPGLVQGLSTAVSTPENTEAGLRQTLTALIDGIGTLLTPEDARGAE